MSDSRPEFRLPSKEKPWLMRTYSGHSNAVESNRLYKTNLAKGQTGLSIAFDLPTQLGYNPDNPLARGEVGKVGVPVVHLGHMEQLMDQLPLEHMNTSMTINATAPWILGLYLALAKRRGTPIEKLSGTTQNDVVKEYLSRGTFIFPPEQSKRLTTDIIAFTLDNVPKWNPINVCSYHLQEAGATPSQEVAYALANAIGVLDALKDSGQVAENKFPDVVARISFFCNAGIRFVEETAKMRAFNTLWNSITRDRYGVTDANKTRFRYGVQVNSLGLTEQQPENNIARIVLETLGVTLSRDARARALQLPAWNEALGLPRPWDQQWSLRIQQILAYESDLLEYPDIFEGSYVMESITKSIIDSASQELEEIISKGGVFNMIEELKERLVKSQTERTTKIERGEITVVGVNAFEESEQSPLTSNDVESHLRVNREIERDVIEDLNRWRSARDQQKFHESKIHLEWAAREGSNIMPPTIEFAMAGGTTGEWVDTLRTVFGEYRSPTGISGGAGIRISSLRELSEISKSLPDGPPRILVAKPGLDGHSNGAEQIAIAARDAGFEVIYQGIRLSTSQIAATARDEDVDLIGLSVLSGSHLDLTQRLFQNMKDLSVSIPVVIGGIIPLSDHPALYQMGVKAIFTPKDFELTKIIAKMIDLVKSHRSTA